jgi:phosphatidylglycerol lysyltransferase
LSEAFRAGILIVEPRVVPLTRYAGRFLTSIQVAGWVSRVYILVLLLRPVVLSDRQEAPGRDVARIFGLYGRHSADAFAVQPDKHHLLLADRRALAAFATKGAVAIACGDPMSSDEDFPGVVAEFTEHCVRHGWTPSFYLASEERLPIYQSLGYASQRAAEEAIIDTSRWTPPTPRQFTVPGMKVLKYNRGSGTDLFLDEQLEEVTEDWLQTRRIGEMGFTIGRFSLEAVTAGSVFLLSKQHRVEAFCVWLPYKNGTAMVLDLMRQRHSAPPNSAEMLISESLRLLGESGVRETSLSAVPLRQSDEQFMNPVDRDFMSIFEPNWENRFIVYPRGASLARIRYALAAVQFGRFRTRRIDFSS